MQWVESTQSLLKRELELRCARNPRYSLRAFARDLGVSAPRLSHVLKGSQGLSRQAAHRIAGRLGWSVAEASRFCDLVDSQYARSKVVREQAQARIESAGASFRTLELDAFRVISEWYHLAILELTQVQEFRSDPLWIAERLGISVHETESAIERLIRLEALERNQGDLRGTGEFLVNPAGIPSDAVRKFHQQILEKAIHAITFQSTEERELSSLILAVRSQDIPEAKKAIREFRDQMNERFSRPRGDAPDVVYALATQFFRIESGHKAVARKPKSKILKTPLKGESK